MTPRDTPDTPIRPAAWTARSWLENPHSGHFVKRPMRSFDVPLYALTHDDIAAVNAARKAKADSTPDSAGTAA